MAHRKPLGTTCATVADWSGPLPVLEDYLVSQAGTWYLVVGVEEKRNPNKVGLVLERIAKPLLADELRVEGRVHEFEWYPRERKRAVA